VDSSLGSLSAPLFFYSAFPLELKEATKKLGLKRLIQHYKF